MSQQKAEELVRVLLGDLEVERKSRLEDKVKNKPKTPDQLWNWIRDVLGYRIPRTVTKEGHRAPFEFISDVYFEKEDQVLVRACRSGGKTLGFAILHLLNSIFKEKFEIVHIGGTQEQALKGYAYYAGDPQKEGETGFIRRPEFSSFVAGEPMVSKTALSNGSKVEVRTGGSAKSVSGPHPNLLAVDELDHIDMQVLNTALQMVQSKGEHKSQIIMGSSQYSYYGTMQVLMDSAEERDISVYEYDMFDIMESCGRDYPKDCRSWECPFYQWHNPWNGKKEELCCGRGAISKGYFPFQDAIKKYLMTTDIETFALQNLLMRGTAEGMVFSKFGDDNVEAFPPEGANLDEWRCFAGVDLRSHGRIVVVAESPGRLPNGRFMRWVIEEWSDDNATPSKIRSAAWNIRDRVRRVYGLEVNVFWMEASASDEAADWQMLGLNGKIIPKEMRSVIYGIGQLRDAFRDAHDIVSIKIDPKCQGLIHAIEKGYRCKRNADGFNRDKPDDKYSHFPDALRYSYVGGPAFRSNRLPEHESVGSWEMSLAQKWTPY